jgi:hypothetical protein
MKPRHQFFLRLHHEHILHLETAICAIEEQSISSGWIKAKPSND